MTESEKLKKALDVLESCITDFRKLKPFLGEEAANAIADIYQKELDKMKGGRCENN